MGVLEEDFKKNRALGIGGSDFDDLLELTEYGCPLRLYYSKTGVEPDYTSDKTALRRGRRLEPIARAYLEEKIKEKINQVPQVIDEAHPHRRVNLDGVTETTKRAVELKTLGIHSFTTIKKNGLPKNYICQLQWGMGLSKIDNGIYGIYQPDSDGLVYFELSFDGELFSTLVVRADEFWEKKNKEIKPTPSWGSEIGDPCWTCQFRKSCRGLNSAGKHALDEF